MPGTQSGRRGNSQNAQLTDQTQSVALPERASLRQRLRDRLPPDLKQSAWEFLILVFVAGYFLFFGLTPYFGGDQVGLVGADEPRYAQIAREMLAAHSQDCHEVHAESRRTASTPKISTPATRSHWRYRHAHPLRPSLA